MKKLSIALAALAAAAFTLPAFAQTDSSSSKDDKATHKDAVEKKQQSNAGAGATSDTKTSKKSKKAKKMKPDSNAGSGSTAAGAQTSGAGDNKATSGTSSPAKP
jgi:mannitol-specific phosphotransferase system IIBC component